MRRGKNDRTARLLKLEHLLYQHKAGYSVSEISDRCGVSRRTVYRDIASLESELNIPLWQREKRYGVLDGFYMPPIRFSMLEAFYVFQSARLMYKYLHKYDENIVSILTKLNSIVSTPFKKHIEQIIDLMQKQPRDEKLIKNITTLSHAWQSGLRVIIYHKSLEAQQPEEIIIDPYFIEPSSLRHASWLIGYCPSTNSIGNFKISRIEKVKLTDIHFEINLNFNGSEYLDRFWHTPHISKDSIRPITIKLKFNPRASKLIEEAIWHPTQVLNHQIDGSIIMTLSIVETKQIHEWILQWGEEVEVLRPAKLRQTITKKIKAMMLLYEK